MKYISQVITGKGRGKPLGFPTLNLQVPKSFSAEFGIYACWVWISKKKYRGALHYGKVPVFDDEEIKLEIFILDYEAPQSGAKSVRSNRLGKPASPSNSAGKPAGRRPNRQSERSSVAQVDSSHSPTHPEKLTFELVKYLRPIENFSSSNALAAQITKDVKQVRLLLSH